jgi:hypothetical protein
MVFSQVKVMILWLIKIPIFTSSSEYHLKLVHQSSDVLPEKAVVIDNTNIDAQTLDATVDTSTSSSQDFFAQGTAETLQRTIYTTDGYEVTKSPDSESFTSKTEQVLPNTWKASN